MDEPGTAIRTDPSNTAIARDWDGDEGDFWARHEERFEDTVAGYRRLFFSAAQIGPTDRVLDIGCGTGGTTREAGRLADRGHALGVDLSARMIEVARDRTAREDLHNVTFAQADAQITDLGKAAFDVAISRAGASFFGDPVAAFRNIASALRPAGRLVLLVWQEMSRNDWASALFAGLTGDRPVAEPESPGPFAFADPNKVRAILSAAGFTAVEFEPASEPMFFGGSVEDAFAFLRAFPLVKFLLSDREQEAQLAALARLRRTIAEHDTGHGVAFSSTAWLVTAVRGTASASDGVG